MKAVVYDAPDAYRRFDARETGWTKVVLTPTAEGPTMAGDRR